MYLAILAEQKDRFGSRAAVDGMRMAQAVGPGSGNTRAFGAYAIASYRIGATCSGASDSEILTILSVRYLDTVLSCSGTAYPSFLGGYRHEVLVELCRTLGSCHPVNDITERHGGVAKRNRRRNTAFHHHDRSAEACGEATADGKAGAGGNRCISPGSANPSNATASARFSPRKDCGA